ncbi:MAG: cation transporter, partial [Acetobacteraceae bacterium]|nr:cation transporter [Acetobacteraceae bacterium]
NLRAQFIHLAADAAVSLGVMVAAFLIGVTSWLWLDPVTSLAIVVVITVSTWGILRESVNMATDAVPENVSRGEVQGFLQSLPGVVEVHDLHIWSLSTTDTALTAHLVYINATPDRSLHALAAELRRRFSINHATIQIETGADAAECRLRPDHVV